MANMLAESEPSPQVAIEKLRESEEMLNKKSKYLEKKIEEETALAMRLKRGNPHYSNTYHKACTL